MIIEIRSISNIAPSTIPTILNQHAINNICYQKYCRHILCLFFALFFRRNMSIIKDKPQNNFTMISNRILKDKELSMKEKTSRENHGGNTVTVNQGQYNTDNTKNRYKNELSLIYSLHSSNPYPLDGSLSGTRDLSKIIKSSYCS